MRNSLISKTILVHFIRFKRWFSRHTHILGAHWENNLVVCIQDHGISKTNDANWRLCGQSKFTRTSSTHVCKRSKRRTTLIKVKSIQNINVFYICWHIKTAFLLVQRQNFRTFMAYCLIKQQWLLIKRLFFVYTPNHFYRT